MFHASAARATSSLDGIDPHSSGNLHKKQDAADDGRDTSNTWWESLVVSKVFTYVDALVTGADRNEAYEFFTYVDALVTGEEHNESKRK